MAELLKIIRRGPRCEAVKYIRSGDGLRGAFLRCDLEPRHVGPLHYDSVDEVWWSADA